MFTSSVMSCRDGRLQERDQILVINGSPLEPGISQQQALTLLQQPGDTVELVVARDRPLNESSPPAVAAAINAVRKVWNSFQNEGSDSSEAVSAQPVQEVNTKNTHTSSILAVTQNKHCGEGVNHNQRSL